MHTVFDLQSVVIGLLIITALMAIILLLMYNDLKNRLAEAKINCRGYIDNNVKDINDRAKKIVSDSNEAIIASEQKTDDKIKLLRNKIASLKPMIKRKPKVDSNPNNI